MGRKYHILICICLMSGIVGVTMAEPQIYYPDMKCKLADGGGCYKGACCGMEYVNPEGQPSYTTWFRIKETKQVEVCFEEASKEGCTGFAGSSVACTGDFYKSIAGGGNGPCFDGTAVLIVEDWPCDVPQCLAGKKADPPIDP